MTHVPDVDWALLSRYAAGECSPEERRELEARLRGQSAYRAAFEAIGMVAEQGDHVMPEVRRAAFMARLRTRFASSAPSRRYFPHLFKVAAAVLLVVGGGMLWRLLSDRSAPVNEQGVAASTFTTKRGERLSIRLSDSTLVVLAPASTLRLAANYGVDKRNVELVGEAAFTVTHDDRRPFVVRAGTLIARDLGTEFVIRAYPDDKYPSVVVREGVVAIGDTALVKPGQLGRLSPAGDPIVEPGDTVAAFAWTGGGLLFNRTPLREAIAQIERWHDVEITLPSSRIRDRGITVTFRHGERTSRVLEVIGAVLHLTAVQTGPRSYTLVQKSPLPSGGSR